MNTTPASGMPTPFFADEVQLAGWTETHTAGCKVTIWLEGPEALEKFRHMTTREGKKAGQRMYAVFVQLNDQDEPIDAAAVADQKTRRGPLCMEAIGMCNNGAFIEWITRGTVFPRTTAGAKSAVQVRLGIVTRKELDEDDAKAEAWKRLKQEYYRRPTFGGHHGHHPY